MGLEPSFSRNAPAWPFAAAGPLPLERVDPAPVIPPGALKTSLRDLLEQGSIAGIDPELSGVSGEMPADPQRTATRPRKWPVAIAASFTLHAAVAMALLAAPVAWYAKPSEQAEIEGADQAGLMVVGNADSDQLTAGDVTQVTLVPMVEARPIETIEAEAVPTAISAEPVEQVAAETPVTERTEPEKPSAARSEPEILTAMPQPTEPDDMAVAVEPARAEPTEETAETVPETPQVVAVLPQARPEPARKPVREKPVEKKPERAKAKAGAGGANQADSKRGVANGSAEGKTAIASSGGARVGIGNAAVSNYPGKIAAKLRRVARTISREAQSSALNNAQVSFVVGAGGDVRTVRLVKSSGSPSLDDAALSIIRRAAPFPPIPAEAGRDNWAFTLPIGPF